MTDADTLYLECCIAYVVGVKICAKGPWNSSS